MPSTNTLRSSLENAREDFSDFETKFRESYPDATGDIGQYILIKLSKEKEGTSEYQIWSMQWNRYCDIQLKKVHITQEMEKLRFKNRVSGIMDYFSK